jgi:hypothetical protein
MTGPPAVRPAQADPGGFQARADGQQVEVRSYGGDLIRIVSPDVAQALIDVGLGDAQEHCIRIKNGLRWVPARFDRPSGRPDLEHMKRRDPERYRALWRGTEDAHVGRGALGRSTIDRSVRVRPAGRAPNQV